MLCRDDELAAKVKPNRASRFGGRSHKHDIPAFLRQQAD